MKPLINLISRVFLALALCASFPVAADDLPDKGAVAAEVRLFAMRGKFALAKDRVREYEEQMAEYDVFCNNGVTQCTRNLPEGSYYNFEYVEPSMVECADKLDIVHKGRTVKKRCKETPAESEPQPESQADYTGLYANAAYALAGTFAPSWVDTRTFAFNEGSQLVTGQVLSIPLNDFTFAATRVQVNDLTDYKFGVKWDWEF